MCEGRACGEGTCVGAACSSLGCKGPIHAMGNAVVSITTLCHNRRA